MAKNNKKYPRRLIDPDLLDLLEIINDSDLSKSYVAEKSGVSRATLDNWTNFRTRRPQNTTLRFVAAVYGYKRKWELQ